VTPEGAPRPVEFDDVLIHPIAKRAVQRITGPLPLVKPT
jgi:hypothetical protein